MIMWTVVQDMDEWLDSNVNPSYQEQSLAQDWARIGKVIEELGEAISELILATGQNPRKGFDPSAKERLLNELADTAMTGIYAIQHFTKDVRITESILIEVQEKHWERITKNGG